MSGPERQGGPPYDDPLPDITRDEQGVGWGDDPGDDERAADERLLADRPPHWDDRD